MAYEKTTVRIAKSQEQIRRMVLAHKGTAFAAISERDGNGNREGFHAQVVIDGKPYQVRVMATMRRNVNADQEEKRIWRVLYHHMKSVFEASDSGVMEFRELMMPYVVTGDGRTIAQHIIPRLEAISTGGRLLAE